MQTTPEKPEPVEAEQTSSAGKREELSPQQHPHGQGDRSQPANGYLNQDSPDS